MAVRRGNLLIWVLKLVLGVDWWALSQSLTTQSALSITLKTSLNLQEWNLFREKHYSTVDHRCNEGEAVVYNHYIGQMTHTELNFCFKQL